VDPEDDKGIDFEFINEAVRRFDEDDLIKPAFIAAVEQLSAELVFKDVNGDYKPYAIVSFTPDNSRPALTVVFRLSETSFAMLPSRLQSQNQPSSTTQRTLPFSKKLLFWVHGSACHPFNPTSP
jgi:hypothetical protein